MADFPTKPQLTQGESPSLYKNVPMPQTSKAKTDGGYEFRRRRFTRTPRRMIETGFRFLSAADFAIVDQFWNDHQEDTAFNWYDYINDTTVQVRFDEYKPEYVGIGTLQLWNVKIKMSEI